MTAADVRDSPATPSAVRRLAVRVPLSELAYRRALQLTGVPPNAADWLRIIDRFMLAFGLMAVLAGVTAFFAYNWDGLSRFAKFALIETGVVFGVALAAWRGLDSRAGQSALFGASFLVGILFAVFGQAYQTGADPYGLFVVWLALIAGWVAIGRQAPLWMLALALANIGLTLYWTEVFRPELASVGSLFGPLAGLVGAVTDSGLAILVFALNAAALILWEAMARRTGRCPSGSWFPRVLAVVMLAVTVAGTTFFIFDAHFGRSESPLAVGAPILFALAAVTSLWYYRSVRRDLFNLTVTLLGTIVVLTSVVARLSSGGGFGVPLLLALLVIAQTGGAAYWLRSIAVREARHGG